MALIFSLEQLKTLIVIMEACRADEVFFPLEIGRPYCEIWEPTGDHSHRTVATLDYIKGQKS